MTMQIGNFLSSLCQLKDAQGVTFVRDDASLHHSFSYEKFHRNKLSPNYSESSLTSASRESCEDEPPSRPRRKLSDEDLTMFLRKDLQQSSYSSTRNTLQDPRRSQVLQQFFREVLPPKKVRPAFVEESLGLASRKHGKGRPMSPTRRKDGSPPPPRRQESNEDLACM
mmetsp:Transcript_16271/g.26472  ORF Transcript_16271/g.26472 Transcript_16271/m.26472 type:complete len:168 (+) Transcript_16271:406-909(+)